MNVVAIDPGMANTGVVYASELSVICWKTISGKPVYTDQYELLERQGSIARQILAFIADKPHEAVVMEGFVNFHGKQNGYTFQTPQLVGYLQRALEHAGENVVMQTSDKVLNPRAKGSMVSYDDSVNGRNLAKQSALKRSGWRGVENLPNDHTRAAMLHACYYYIHKEDPWET